MSGSPFKGSWREAPERLQQAAAKSIKPVNGYINSRTEGFRAAVLHLF